MSNRDIYDNIYDSMKDLYGIDVSAGMSKTFGFLAQTEGFKPSADGIANHRQDYPGRQGVAEPTA